MVLGASKEREFAKPSAGTGSLQRYVWKLYGRIPASIFSDFLCIRNRDGVLDVSHLSYYTDKLLTSKSQSIKILSMMKSCYLHIPVQHTTASVPKVWVCQVRKLFPVKSSQTR